MNDLGCYRDKTYCATPDCKNECGRKMSEEVRQLLAQDKHGRTAYAYFCGEPSQQFLDNLSLLYLQKLSNDCFKGAHEIGGNDD